MRITVFISKENQKKWKHGRQNRKWKKAQISKNARNANMRWYWEYKIKRGANIEKCKGCKYAMILGWKTNSGRRLKSKETQTSKMQGIQIWDDTGNTKSKEAQISKKCKGCKYAMILGRKTNSGRRLKSKETQTSKMQGIQIWDDTGNTKSKEAQISKKCKGCKYAMILGRKTNSGRRLADRRDWVDKLQCILSEMMIIISSWSWWLNHHIMSMIMIIIMIMIIKIQTRCNSACQRRWWLQYLSIWWWSWWFKLK